MEWIETTGKTLADAVEVALDRLGVHEDDLEYEVLQEPKTGFLGRKDAHIRARVKPISREKPGGERRRRGGKRPDARGRGGRNRPESRSGGGNRGNGRPKDGAGDAPAGSGGPRSGDARSSGNGSAPGGTGSGGRRRRRGGRGRGTGEGSSTGPNSTQESGERRTPGRDKEHRVSDSTDSMVTVQEQADAAAEFTRGLVEAFGYTAEVTTREEDDDVVIVDVEGEGLGLLVGPKGATLHAIEELVRTAVQRQTEGHGARIHVDVGGYRARRREALEQFARGLAEEVRETGTRKALEPMSASDRKAVHDAVAEVDGVATTSEGEDPRRRVVISPA